MKSARTEFVIRFVFFLAMFPNNNVMYAKPFVRYLQLSVFNHCSDVGFALLCYSGGTVVNFQYKSYDD